MVSKDSLPHHVFQRLAAVHGPIFSLRLGSMNVVVISDTSTAKQALRTNDLALASRPKLSAPRNIVFDGQDVALADYSDKEMRDVRKFMVLELLSNKKLETFRNVKEDELSWLALSVAKASEQLKTFELREYIVGVAYNVITRILMGKRYYGAPPDDKEYEEGVAFKRVIDEALKFGMSGTISDFFPHLSFLDWKAPQSKKVRRELDKFLQRRLDEHRQPGREKCQTDFLDMILEESSFKSDDRIKGVMFDLITGGTDTSSSIVEWTMAELLTNPRVLARAQEEVEAVVGRGRKVEESDVRRMPYLEAVIKEALRLHPPIPMLVPHYSNQDCTINSYTIPRDTTVFVNAYAMGRDPNVWKNSMQFDPERFLTGPDKDVELFGQNVGFQLIPFGSGRRSCPGAALGYSTVHLTLATLLQCFDWKAGKSVDFSEAQGAAKIMKFPLVVQPTPRFQIERVYTTNQWQHVD